VSAGDGRARSRDALSNAQQAAVRPRRRRTRIAWSTPQFTDAARVFASIETRAFPESVSCPVLRRRGDEHAEDSIRDVAEREIEGLRC